ncbi:MFS transporter [Nitratidesulfovibrio sp. 1201_IL3209]|uniref:MFS transporter n=1 Tax=Nitratidesulfovibrio sp. 1201_IL3209 TaxID=3084053 RepID=UPI002FDB4804
MHIGAIQRLRVNTLLLSLGVLALTLGFNVLLSSSTLDGLATDSILSGYRSCGEHFARGVERGLRFGKFLNAYAGMDDMLAELRHGVQGIDSVQLFDAKGELLYARPDSRPDSGVDDLRAGAEDLKQFSAHAEAPPKARKTPTGYRVLVPLQHNGLAGWVAMEVASAQVDAATRDFLRWSGFLMLATCLAVALILPGWLGLLTGTAEARARLHATLGRLLLVVVGGTQLAYSCGTLALFDGFVERAVRTKAAILAQSVGRDFEYLIHKGVDVAQLKGKEQLLAQLVADNEELRGAALLSPDGVPLATAGSPSRGRHASDVSDAPDAPDAPDAALSVREPLDRYWPSRFRQRQEVMELRLDLDPQVITARVTKLAVDMGTSLVISFLLLLELAKLLGLIAQRSLGAEAGTPPPDQARPRLPHAAQALRVGGFVFFLGYDMGISFIPLLARTLYQPLWGLSEKVVIGLPISAEMVSAGVALLVSGSFTQRYGWHRIYMLGAAAGAAGLLLGGMATGLPMLILARITAGFGFGLVLMASQIGTLEHERAGAGLASVFAGIFSGSICGSAAGAMLAEHLPYQSVLTVGGVVTLFAMRAVLTGRDRATAHAPRTTPPTANAVTTEDAAGTARTPIPSGGMALLKDPRMHLMLLLVGIPVAVCLTGFLHYLLPLMLANAKVDQSDIGRVFMLYGLCFITAGPLLGKWIDRTADKPLFLTLAGLLSGVSLLLAASATGLAGTSAAVVALGLSQCIAAPASMLCILALRSARELGREKTASLYRALERVGQVAGPVLFGAATVVMGTTQVLLVVGGTVCTLALAFQAAWRLSAPRS